LLSNKIVVFLLLVVFSGCSYRALKGYERAGPGTAFEPVSWFITSQDHMLLTTSMDVMKHHFSGLIVVKPVESGYRTVFMTETGIKIFDMEFIQGKPVQVYYMMEAMNKKVLVQTLQHDMALALMQLNRSELKFYIKDKEGRIIMTKENGRKNYFAFPNSCTKPSGGIQASGMSRKAFVNYYTPDGLQLDSLFISHYHMKLRIKMKTIHDAAK
jgi:hypothetical protein